MAAAPLLLDDIVIVGRLMLLLLSLVYNILRTFTMIGTNKISYISKTVLQNIS